MRKMLPNQQPTLTQQDADRLRYVLPRKNPGLLKVNELGIDERGNLCLGLGDGQFHVIVYADGAEGNARAVIRRETKDLVNNADARAHDRQHYILSADDHSGLSQLACSLWERDGSNDLVLTGMLDGHTGLWALDNATGDVCPGAFTAFGDTYWEQDSNGDLMPKAVS